MLLRVSRGNEKVHFVSQVALLLIRKSLSTCGRIRQQLLAESKASLTLSLVWRLLRFLCQRGRFNAEDFQ